MLTSETVKPFIFQKYFELFHGESKERFWVFQAYNVVYEGRKSRFNRKLCTNKLQYCTLVSWKRHIEVHLALHSAGHLTELSWRRFDRQLLVSLKLLELVSFLDNTVKRRIEEVKWGYSETSDNRDEKKKAGLLQYDWISPVIRHHVGNLCSVDMW